MTFLAPVGGRIGSFISSRLARGALSRGGMRGLIRGGRSEITELAAKHLETDLRAIGEFRSSLGSVNNLGVNYGNLTNGQRVVLNNYCREPMANMTRAGGTAEDIAYAGNSADFTGSLSETIKDIADAIERAMDGIHDVSDMAGS